MAAPSNGHDAIGLVGLGVMGIVMRDTRINVLD